MICKMELNSCLILDTSFGSVKVIYLGKKINNCNRYNKKGLSKITEVKDAYRMELTLQWKLYLKINSGILCKKSWRSSQLCYCSESSRLSIAYSQHWTTNWLSEIFLSEANLLSCSKSSTGSLNVLFSYSCF